MSSGRLGIWNPAVGLASQAVVQHLINTDSKNRVSGMAQFTLYIPTGIFKMYIFIYFIFAAPPFYKLIFIDFHFCNFELFQ